MTSEDGDGPSAAPAPAPVKRSLFKKSAYAKPARTEEDAPLDLFSRREQVFSNVIAERERERLQKLASLEKARADRDAVGKAAVTGDGGGGKRRRLSAEWQDSSDDGTTLTVQKKRDSNTTTPQSRDGRSSSSPGHKKPEASPIRPPQAGRTRNAKSTASKPIVISISDSDDSDGPVQKAIRPIPVLSDDDDDDDDDLYLMANKQTIQPKEAGSIFQDEDEELFPELVAKARQNQKNIMAQQLARVTSQQAPKGSVFSDGEGFKSDSSDAFRNSAISAPDPVLKIIVSSCIEGTKPVVLKRKLSQRLKDVRIAWCDMQVIQGQPMQQTMKDSIFLTWRRHKLFDVSTCGTLGLKFSPDGKPVLEGDGFNGGQIHLEAWTDEDFQNHKRQLEEERRRAVADPLAEEDEREATPQVQEEARKIRIILTAREYDKYNVKVTPTTVWSKVIAAFRKARNISPEMTISLRLDGDELEPMSTVDEADLDDMTSIDVHIS